MKRKSILALAASVMLMSSMTVSMTSCAENDVPVINPEDPKEQFHIYLCFGQSNMEGNATPEAMDKKDVSI